MFPTIPEVLADALAREWCVATPRTMRLARLRDKADVVIGSRRVGKSWLLQHHTREVEASGVDRRRILYLNFEDERLDGLQAAHLGDVVDEWSRRVPGLLEGERWLLLDEIQVVPGWERFVRRLVEDRHTRLVVTGSSARMLSREIATSLRGRALTHELLPLSFAEALRRHTADIAWVRNSDGTEVDFVATGEDGRLQLVQACLAMGREDTRAREVHALTHAMAALGVKEGTIVTLADREEIATAEGRITVVPAWEWVLRA